MAVGRAQPSQPTQWPAKPVNGGGKDPYRTGVEEARAAGPADSGPARPGNAAPAAEKPVPAAEKPVPADRPGPPTPGSAPGSAVPATGSAAAGRPRRRVAVLPRLAPVLGGVAATAVAAYAQLLAGRDLPSPSGAGEALIDANGYAVAELGGLVVPAGLSDQAASLHVAGWDILTAASLRYPSTAGAVREVLVAFVALAALSLFLLCRNLGLSVAAAFAAVVVGFVAPAVATADTLVYAGTIATGWLLAGAVLLAVQPASVVVRSLTRTLGLALVALAGILAPVVLLLPAGIFITAVATGTLFPRWGRVRRAVAVLAVVAVMAGAAMLSLDELRGAAPNNVRTQFVIAVGAAGLVLVALAVWRLRWARPLAVGAVPLLAAVLVPWAAREQALVAALPVAAVLLVAVVEDLATTLRRPTARVGPILAAALAVLAVVGLAVLPANASPADGGQPQAELAAWLPTNVDPSSTVQVDPQLWVDLVRAGVPVERLRRTDQVTAATVTGPLLAERGAEHAGFPLVAQFGSGPFAISVRQRVDSPAAAQLALIGERAASQRFGSSLADNPRLSLQGDSQTLMRSGDVDGRLLVALATATMSFTFTVEEFLPSPGTDEGMLRSVRISNVTALSPSSDLSQPDAVRLRDFLRFQLEPYRPLTQAFADSALVVTYAAPSMFGLLP